MLCPVCLRHRWAGSAFLSAVFVVSTFRLGNAVARGVDPLVHELCNQTFDNGVAAFPVVFLVFYAPWCTHSTHLLNEVEKVAETLLGRAAMFKIDVGLWPDIGRRWNIQQTPAAVLFQMGSEKEVEEYGGPRENSSIVDWIEIKSLSSLFEVEEGNLTELLENEMGLPYFVARGGHKRKEQWSRVANANRHIGSFLFVNSSKEEEEEEELSVSLHRGFSETLYFNISSDAEDSWPSEAIVSFFRSELVSPFWVINDDNYAVYMSRAQEGMVWALFKPDKWFSQAKALKDVFYEVAHSFKRFPVVFLDTHSYRDYVRKLVGCNKLPQVVIQLGNYSNVTEDLRSFSMPLPEIVEEVTAGPIVSWLHSVIAGKVEEDADPSEDELDWELDC
eukprot:TRINITY_DN73867_c0_g1_i1.p1 TRINITY_DN73867_c0_g1~~TRINITY_DN73867_c0_g1_i1.p1  ORF type:complete len:389 (-),score=72.42 TRINITY_DN73867_c0_g1_i1:88-1254(-)